MPAPYSVACLVDICGYREKVAKLRVQAKETERFRLEEQEMNNTRENYKRLKKILEDEEFRGISSYVLDMKARMDSHEDPGEG